MGFLDRFKAKPSGEEPNESTPQPEAPQAAAPSPATSQEADPMRVLLSQFVGPVTLRQMAFADVLDGQKWHIDFNTGILTVGRHSFPFQFLGSESDESDTWMWGVNNINEFPDFVLTAVREVYDSLPVQDVPALRAMELPLVDPVSGHNIATIAAGIFPGKHCYYRCAYEGGAAFVLVRDLPDAVFAPPSSSRVVSTLQSLIAQQSLDHKMLAETTLHHACTNVTRQPDGISGTCANGSTIAITFDRLGRIANVKVTA